MRKAILCFIRRNDEVLMICDNYPTGAVWNGISGFIEEHETAPDAAVREVKEEIGIDVTQSDLKYLGTYDPFTLFEVWHWEGIPRPLEQGITDIKWFNINELPYDQMHKNNQDWLPAFLK